MNSYGSFQGMPAGTGALQQGSPMTVFNVSPMEVNDKMKDLKQAWRMLIQANGTAVGSPADKEAPDFHAQLRDALEPAFQFGNTSVKRIQVIVKCGGEPPVVSERGTQHPAKKVSYSHCKGYTSMISGAEAFFFRVRRR